MFKAHVSIRLAGCLLAALCFARPARAEPADWPQWRGPTLNGAGSAKNLPDKLDPKEAAWATELPGPGAGTPIVHGDRVFVSALDKGSKKLVAICVSRKDGKTLWSHEVANGFQTNPRNNMASPSPLTDGKLVFFHFASGDLIAFDYDGKEVWKRNLVQHYGPFNYMWIYGSSPLLYEGKLYVQVLHNSRPYTKEKSGPNPAESYLLAMDPATGKELWRQVRPDEANNESKESYGTPIPFEHDGKKEIVVSGGDVVTGHDPETGRELWRFGGWNPEKIGHWRMVSSVATGADLVFASPPKGGKLFAIKANGQGDVTDSHLAWRSNDVSTDVCAPLFYNDKLYVLDGDRKRLNCLDPKTGKVLWSGDLKSRQVFRASPTAGDGKIYCMNEDGRAWVLAADAFKILYEGDLGEDAGPARASIALADGQAFVRTADKLYCFGGK